MVIKSTVTVGIYYYMPDYASLINEFWWQHTDLVPELPRTHQFLNYWKDNIDAVIKEVLVSHSYLNTYKSIEWDFKLNG